MSNRLSSMYVLYFHLYIFSHCFISQTKLTENTTCVDLDVRCAPEFSLCFMSPKGFRIRCQELAVWRPWGAELKLSGDSVLICAPWDLRIHSGSGVRGNDPRRNEEGLGER